MSCTYYGGDQYYTIHFFQVLRPPLCRYKSKHLLQQGVSARLLCPLLQLLLKCGGCQCLGQAGCPRVW